MVDPSIEEILITFGLGALAVWIIFKIINWKTNEQEL